MQEHHQQNTCGGRLGALARVLKYFEFQSWRINVISKEDFYLRVSLMPKGRVSHKINARVYFALM
jgi:hypothetical protein